jgi:hypothetical protein
MTFANRWWRLGVLSCLSALAAAGPAAPASAVDVKVYSGLGCRAAELPPAPQPTFNPNGTAFNQNRGEHLRLLCPVVKDADRILAVRVRVVAVRPNRIGCTLRTLRDDGSAQQTASSSHDPLSRPRPYRCPGHLPRCPERAEHGRGLLRAWSVLRMLLVARRRWFVPSPWRPAASDWRPQRPAGGYLLSASDH